MRSTLPSMFSISRHKNWCAALKLMSKYKLIVWRAFSLGPNFFAWWVQEEADIRFISMGCPSGNRCHLFLSNTNMESFIWRWWSKPKRWFGFYQEEVMIFYVCGKLRRNRVLRQKLNMRSYWLKLTYKQNTISNRSIFLNTTPQLFWSSEKMEFFTWKWWRISTSGS